MTKTTKKQIKTQSNPNQEENAESKSELKEFQEEQKSVSFEEYAEIKDTLQRLQAEFTNYRKRSEEDQKKFILMSNIELLKKILPVLDNFELALETKTKGADFVKGMELIYSQFKDILADEGLSKINAVGKFNPELHEAVMVEESENEPNTILEEFQKGYVINDRIIRHSKVKISKKIGGK